MYAIRSYYEFYSNSTTVKSGWASAITCTEEENEVPAQNCELAPRMCAGETYEGSTSSFYNPNTLGGIINSTTFPGGTLDNNAFLKFVASSTSILLITGVSNCSTPQCGTASEGGIQLAVITSYSIHYTKLYDNKQKPPGQVFLLTMSPYQPPPI